MGSWSSQTLKDAKQMAAARVAKDFQLRAPKFEQQATVSHQQAFGEVAANLGRCRVPSEGRLQRNAIWIIGAGDQQHLQTPVTDDVEAGRASERLRTGSRENVERSRMH